MERAVQVSTDPMNNGLETLGNTPFFEYNALEDRYDIRLLQILPGEPEETVSCECIHYSSRMASETTAYTAISYTWGDPTPNHPILLNNRTYYTTESAVEILRHARNMRGIGKIWIDAICIDQSNIPEKNDQVRLMGHIYSSAQQTLVWLGPSAEDSAMAMEFVSRMRGTMKNLEGAEEVTDKMLLEQISCRHDSRNGKP